MKLISLLLLSLFTKIFLIEEKNITKNETKAEADTKNIQEEFKEEEGYYSGNKIYDLNDMIFDYMIREGKIYRWFILFYSKTCGHCRRARKEINKVFEDLKTNNTLRFAQMEAYDNTLTNVRFNITGVPYIILIENNSILELDLFPNYENLKNFISTNFSEVKEELKPLPKRVKFTYVAWVIFKQTLDSITEGFNNLLKRHNINIKFNSLTFVISVLTTIILCCVGMVKCCIYCCCNDEDIAKELKLLEEQYNLEMEKRKQKGEQGQEDENQEGKGEDNEGEEGEEGEGEELEDEEEEEDDEEEEEEEDDEGEEEEDESKKEKTEEQKKIIEEKKEEEFQKKEDEKTKKDKKEKKEKKNGVEKDGKVIKEEEKKTEKKKENKNHNKKKKE